LVGVIHWRVSNTGFRIAIDPKYIGPVFVTDSTTALRHPEHGDHEYAELEMVVAVVYQKSLDALQREQRTRD
jgi:hypothetical protein